MELGGVSRSIGNYLQDKEATRGLRVNGSSGLSTASYTENLITQACFTQ